MVLAQGSYLHSTYAARSSNAGRFRTVVISGGGSPVALAGTLAEFIQSMGVPREAIVLEGSARSTRENALYTKAILDRLPGKKVLLASDDHAYRSERCFRKLGVKIAVLQFPDAGKRAQSIRGRWPAFLDEAEETVRSGTTECADGFR